MDEGPIPGARVRATTKHGALTVDEIAAMQPGMARLMDELSRRYWTLFYAAKARNWALASYMAKEAQKILKTASVARPKYSDDIAAFLRSPRSDSGCGRRAGKPGAATSAMRIASVRWNALLNSGLTLSTPPRPTGTAIPRK